MKKTTLLAAALLLLMPCALAQTSIENLPHISVIGTAKKSVAPNIIDVTISLSEAESKGKMTMNMLDNDLYKAFKDTGIDIDTQVWIISQSSAADKKQNAYQYKNYVVRLHSAGEATMLFTNLVANNISTASVRQTTHSNAKAFEQEVKIAAVQNAKQTAEVLAKAIDQSIGKAITISELSVSTSSFGGTYNDGSRRNKAEEVVNPLLDVKFTDIDISQSVSVRFILE